MIELKSDQLQAMDTAEQLVAMVDPRTGQEYLLIRRETYEKLTGMVRSFNRGWNDPEMDVYEQYRKKA